MKKLISHSNYSMPRRLSAQPGLARGLRAAAVLLCLWGLLALPARAALTYWDRQGNSGGKPYTDDLSGSWEDAYWSTKPNGQHTPQNWVVNTTAAFAVHTGAGTPPFTVTMNADYTVAGIFNGAGTGSGACDVTLTGTGNLIVPSGLQEFNASNSGGGAKGYLRLNVPLTGTGAVVAAGNGQLFFHAANSYTGGTYLGYGNAPWNGTLNFSNSAAFSTGPIIIGRSGGTLQLEGTEALTLANAVISTNTPATNVLHLAGNLTFSGPWTLGVATRIGITGADNVVTLSGVIDGAGALTKTGLGTLVLASANTFTGATTVSQGTLAFAGGSLSASPLTVAAGATLANTTADTLALGGATTLNAGALVALNAAGGAVGKLSVAGDLALNANVLSINVSGDALVPGSYRLMECAGTLSGAAAVTPALSGTPLASGLTATVATVAGPGGYVDLLVQAVPAFSGLTASPAVTYGATNLLLSGTFNAEGPLYPAQGETISVTINGITQDATITDAAGNFSLTYDASALTVDGSPYTITYTYAGNAWLTGATDASTALTVNPAPLTVTADNATRDYGQENPAFTASLVGLVNGDAITAAASCEATATSLPGQYAIVPSLLDPNNRLGNYTVTAINGTLTILDTAIPTVAITSAVSALVYDPALTISGTASDDMGVDSVLYQFNNGAWTPATTTDGWANWSVSLTLSPGTNVFSVKSRDTNGNLSPICTVSVVYAINTFPAKGTYTGLFYETNAVAPASSGTFTLTTTTGRRFSGSLQVAGRRYALRGGFDTNGLAEVAIPAHKPNALHVALKMDLCPGVDRIDGTVSDGTWTAVLAGDRVVYDGKQQVAPERGAYTLVIPGSDEQASEPCGNGYGTVSVSKAGRIHLAATLADGTKLSQSAIVSKYGQWPLYRSLYSRHGLVLGWLNFTNDAAATLNLGGDLSWLKPGSTSKYYSSGFMVHPTAVGARWTAPAKVANVVTFPSGSVTLSGGNLSQSLTNAFEFGLKFKVLDQSGNELRLKFSRSSGVFTGSVFDPVSEQRIPFGGVLLQGLNAGYGCFLGTDQSGQVFLGQ